MECLSSPRERPLTQNRVKPDLSHLEAQQDGESTTRVGVSVKVTLDVSLFRKLTQEVNNTKLSLVAISAIVEPQLDVSSQVPNQAFIFKSQSLSLSRIE